MKSKALFFLFLVMLSGFANGQTVRTARLLQFRPYMIDVVTATIQSVEDDHWCNLKIPEWSQDVNFQFFGLEYDGNVTYTNGHLVTMQRVDIVETSIQQVWTWNRVDLFGTVDARIQMRLHNVELGFDVIAVLNGETYRYTSTFTYPMVTYNFSILKNMQERHLTVTVTGVDPRSSGRSSYSPNDLIGQIIGTSFSPASTTPGILAWGPEVFRPKVENAVSVIEFPEACYNC